jgi:type I restriction enzyme S subunit
MMKRFDQVQLSNVANIISGYAFKSEDLTNNKSDVPVLKIANVTPPVATLVFEDHFPRQKISDRIAKYFIRDRDVLVAMTGMGSVGRVSVVRSIGESVLLNQRVGIVRGKRSVFDQQFLGCVLTAEHYEKTLYDLGIGAGQPNVSPKDIGNLLVPLPPFVTQQKIAAILSAYDELIENNKRRIALLEKMAEEIYREWFVRLRFPGHEKVKVVKGVPEDWQLSTLGAICNIKGGKRLPNGHSLVDQKTDHPYIKSRDIRGGDIKGTELQFVEDRTFEKIKRYIVNQGDICITIVANIGDVGIVPPFLDGASLTENAVKLTNLKQGVSSIFLAYTLSMPRYKEYMELLAAGAAQSKLGLYKIKSIKVWIPHRELMDTFDAQIKVLRKQVQLLEESNKLLQVSRDLLLPRLISGKLSVENFDIQFPPSMAEEMSA